ncbi:L-histidine N(alpha)-methyltransferase [soil metagenome]|nr:L-histidine N(alpha)-methyltransferase [Acidobacteriota bacterium]
MTIGSPASTFAAEVARDLRLQPKQLQSKYLYDALGSSLFDAICRLPWYRVTRAESRLLTAHAREVVRPLVRKAGSTVVELGCGNGEKIVLLAEALLASGGSARVHLIDISPQALEQTEERLTRLHVSVVGHQSPYEEGLRRAAAAAAGGGPMLVLLLGSNIGNFDGPEALNFLQRIRATLGPLDFLLLGTDLVKPERELLLAYDDPLGVTAAFNRNLLVRVNRELGGDFDIERFGHVALWNEAEQRVEMHLESGTAQMVHVAAADLTVRFEPGERIWTESSCKYTPEQVQQMGADADFAICEQWIDQKARFALTLFGAA